MAEGLVEFTARFPRAVWLEVMLLAGVTAVEAEVKKLATLARRIGAKRVQLNTVVRPPCETFASAVPAHRMQALAALFSPPAEVICPPANAPPAGADRAASDKDILALLRRRPCTAQGVAEGLGIHVAEAVKRLQELAERRLVDSTHRDGAVYHTAAGNG
jgi:CRP-like cAMP-binding protein